MKIFSSTLILLHKDFQLEWRNKYALNGILLYTVGAVFICYMSFNVKIGILNPIAWNALFWIIILLSAINAISKSFADEGNARNLYYYTLVSPQALIVSKIIYNIFLLLILSLSGFGFYSIVMGNPIQDMILYLIAIFLAAIGFASSLTLVAAIASKVKNNGTLMSILSFPILIPIVLIIIKITKNAMDGLERINSFDEIAILIAINSIVITISCILFPYLWRN